MSIAPLSNFLLSNICLIGYGFMGKAHSNAIARLPMFFPEAGDIARHTLCGVGADALAQAAARYGWLNHTEDALAAIENRDIHAVDIATPTDTHMQYTLFAAEHGKHIFCEKPLASSLSDARLMLEAAQKAGVVHQMGFNYRFAPAVTLLKRFLDQGRLGRVYHVRGSFLQDWLADPDGLIEPIHPIDLHIDTAKMEALFNGGGYAEDYRILSREIRQYGETIPPLINSYMNLSPSMRVFDTVMNPDFGGVEETGILIAYNDIYQKKVERHFQGIVPGGEKFELV